VLYVTNRQRNAGADPEDAYGGRRGQLRYGECRVRFTTIPVAEAIARRVPFFVPSEIRDVRTAGRKDGAAFWSRVDEAVGGRHDLPIVLFVHGYSYGFGRTCRMGAELQRMLAGRAKVVMFSWPSDANPVDYVADQVDVEWSVPDLASLLAELESRYGAGRLDVLAHSLGTRGVIFALERLRMTGFEGPVVGRLVLLAPDYDRESFVRQLELFRPMVGGISLYASDNDTLLALSAALHDHARLGQAGERLLVLPGIETVDVTPVGRYHPSGHEYHYYHPMVAADLIELLAEDTPPSGRPNLERREHRGLTYWALTRGE
jgi:esterase/lipase superfamily enzyme